MNGSIPKLARYIFTVRWQPSSDLAAVAVSWILVVGTLYTATVVVTPEAGGGIPYFLLYGVVMAMLAGIGFPVFWMIMFRKRALSSLGLTWGRWRLSLAIQIGLAAILYITGPGFGTMPFNELVPLIALVIAIGFFEAVFWRGWVLSRFEESFGFLPALIAGSLLYAAYHVGYAMTLDDMVFLFFIGIMFALVFKITGSVLILWPLFQPMGQLITLTGEGLELPLLSALGFVEVAAVMLLLVWLAGKYRRKYINRIAASDSASLQN